MNHYFFMGILTGINILCTLVTLYVTFGNN